MTKRELVMEVAAATGITQNEVANVVQSMLDAVSESLARGERLEIRNFGVFEVKERDSRIGRNPRTGEKVPIQQKRVATFKPGKALKEWVQAGPDGRPHALFESEDDHHEAPPAPAPVATPESANNGQEGAPAPTGEQQSLF